MLTIDELLRRGGPCKITLWVGEDSSQANIQEPGSSGWHCVTRRNAAEALHAALMERPLFRGRTDTPLPAPAQAEEVSSVGAPRRVVVARKPAAPVAPIRRVVRRV